tara:strand:- start:615 stop:1040 length:426 start_codon:yes stop_codon:yes gene_type:complete
MKEKGFTLFELLVSISIIAILTALVSLSYSAAQKKARDARRRQDMGSVQKAAEQYYALNNYSYPTSYSSGSSSWSVGGETVLNLFPVDPKNVAPYQYSCSIGAATGYCCCATMENNSNGNASDASCTFATTGGYYCIENQQ